LKKKNPKLLNLVNPIKRLLLKYGRRTFLFSFEDLWKKHGRFPDQISLGLSLLCPSNCIYCAERGTHMAPRTMPMELVTRILDEAQAQGFRGRFSLSENGEALLHPRFEEILTDVRRRFPENEIILFTNMVLMDEARARLVLERKVDHVRFNLDGSTEATYEYIKRNRSFHRVKQNIAAFLHMRNELHSPCKVGIGFVTAKSFTEDIEGRVGVFEDDSREILGFLQPMLRPGDEIGPDPVTIEKYQFALNRPKREPCDLFYRTLVEMMIAPNGQVYICCADFGMRSSLGNVNEQSLAQIWSGEKRKTVLKNLALMQYEGAFPVCRTCLPSYNYSTNRDVFFRVRRQVRDAFCQGKLKLVNSRLVVASSGDSPG
jgi:radical SAM protein with 4Fe4S-binding SPASM domain